MFDNDTQHTVLVCASDRLTIWWPVSKNQAVVSLFPANESGAYKLDIRALLSKPRDRRVGEIAPQPAQRRRAASELREHLVGDGEGLAVGEPTAPPRARQTDAFQLLAEVAAQPEDGGVRVPPIVHSLRVVESDSVHVQLSQVRRLVEALPRNKHVGADDAVPAEHLEVRAQPAEEGSTTSA